MQKQPWRTSSVLFLKSLIILLGLHCIEKPLFDLIMISRTLSTKTLKLKKCDYSSWRPHEMVKGKRKKIKRSYFLLRRCNFSLASPIYIHLKRMMFFNVPFFVSNQDGLNGCYYTSWIAQGTKILSEVAFLLQP